MYSLLLTALSLSISKSSVICGVGVDWHYGDIVLEDLIGDTMHVLTTTHRNLNSLTGQGTNGPFYTIGHQAATSEFTLFKFTPCSNSTLEAVGSIVMTGYDIRGLAYNPNDDLLYALFFAINSSVTNRLYSIDPYIIDPDTLITVTYIADINDDIETLEFDVNGVLYAWSASNNLITINQSTGDINIINKVSHQTPLGSLQFLAFDTKDVNTIYAGFQKVYKINKLNGSYTLTPYDAHMHRGFHILDQNTCDQIECSANQPTEDVADVEEVVQSENSDDFTVLMEEYSIIIGVVIISICCCVAWFCRKYHKSQIESDEESPTTSQEAVAKQIEMNGFVAKEIDNNTAYRSNWKSNVIGDVNWIPGSVTSSQYSYNPTITTYSRNTSKVLEKYNSNYSNNGLSTVDENACNEDSV